MEKSIETLVERIGNDLQEIENCLKSEGDRCLKIRFPRGYLRKAKFFRKQYWFISNPNLQRNIAYTLILSDVYRWLLNRTDLYGTAREMIIKEGICLVGSLCESITKDVAQHKNICGKNAGYKQRTAAMVEQGMISDNLKKDLDDLWDWRNREHLFLLDEWEYGKYTLKRYNDAIRVLGCLRESLDAYFRKTGKPHFDG
ncbi:hypothetical protein [Pyrinomonas methylaliphatogenes]|uniref:Uncharacterized protein n=1 Tax=Pyrinomonas methylaliphatogenes TaxID=454194 RepID=A0A0B6X349_9BACT|nr:hypothetical protein [Pyrinomonas methylaliphatogenes]CDM66725.1 hypothetical protein PYK22_02758 [Pyrinomonas methylaliphatogenes]